MAEFKPAFSILEINEGLLSNHPLDKGRLTWKGISETANPDFSGWSIIKSTLQKYKNQNEAIKTLIENLSLQDKVETFYLGKWSSFKLEYLKEQTIANFLFDAFINHGTKNPTLWVQTIINVFNRNQKLYPDVEVDGVFGSETYTSINKYIGNGATSVVSTSDFLKILIAKRINFYIDLMIKNNTQEEFAKGWFKRMNQFY